MVRTSIPAPRSALECARFLPYDTAVYDFARVIAEDVFAVEQLEQLHHAALAEKRQRCPDPQLRYGDNMRLRTRLACVARPSRFYDLFDRLVSRVVAREFGRMSCNSRPTFRVHMAGTPSVSDWHTDVEVTGRHDQITAWVPFTHCSGTNTLWVESDYGRGDYQPVAVRYGEIFLFDGGYLKHGSVPNETQSSRVGMDFRFAPLRTELPGWDRGILSGRPVGYRPACRLVTPSAAVTPAGGRS